jgi:hypothetical protein
MIRDIANKVGKAIYISQIVEFAVLVDICNENSTRPNDQIVVYLLSASSTL